MTEFTKAKLAELRAVAEVATPGPWEWQWEWHPPSDDSWPSGDESLVTSNPGENGYPDAVLSGRGYDESGIEASDEDRAHIAAFDPLTALALIDALEAANESKPSNSVTSGAANERELADLRAELEAKTAELDAKADYVSDLEERVRQRDNHVIPVLHARIKEAELERDEARAEARFWMDRRATEAQIDQFNRDRADRAEAALAEAQQSLTELAPSAAIMPTEEVVVDGDVFTWGDLPGVLSRTRASLAEARQEAKGQYVKRQNAEVALERVRALHRKAHAIFSWSEGGVRYEEPCENCNGAPGVHDCGCWADVQVEYVCAECDRGKGKHRDSGWPCPTVQAIEGADQ